MNEVRQNPQSGARISIYRNAKCDLATESYVANVKSVGLKRCWLASRQAACHWTWRLASTLGHHTARGHVAYVIVESWRTNIYDLPILPYLKI